MGPLPLTPRGHQYNILAVTDLFTKWVEGVEAFPLVNTTAHTLAILMNDIVCCYGVPAYLHSNQGANLCSTVIQELCKLLSIQITRTSAYHPEGNGQVERFSRLPEAMLAKMIDGGDQIYLPKVLLAYCTSLHEVTGFTAYHLVFGHSPQLHIDVMLGRVTNTKVQSFPQFVQQIHKYLKEAYSMMQQPYLNSMYAKKLNETKEALQSNCRLEILFGCTPQL